MPVTSVTGGRGGLRGVTLPRGRRGNPYTYRPLVRLIGSLSIYTPPPKKKGAENDPGAIPNMSQNDPKTIRKRSEHDPENGPKMIRQRSENGPKTIRKLSKNNPKIIRKLSETYPKMIRTRSKNGPRTTPTDPLNLTFPSVFTIKQRQSARARNRTRHQLQN